MISIIDEYFSLNRAFLLIVGLWPYQRSKFVRFYSFCCYSIIVTTVLLQFATLVTSKCTADYVIKFCSILFVVITLIVTYNSFYVNGDKLRYLMEQIQLIYDDLKDNNEIAIFKRYVNISKRYTTAFISKTILFIYYTYNILTSMKFE
ncbi:uncharacterized protein LOC118647787 [Monomorium pharaonis]|uniref:uncharacterized protein LOC118647787 n=1 Tax=Monomorium pharaonis TaxID=307658 RepID=UPI00174776F7|nr:uncharacterized protein LOC118647787 [Monomorium pharaonis]